MKKLILLSFLVSGIFLSCASSKKKSSETKEKKTVKTIGDSLFFSMSKTACYGRCPVYEVKVYLSGYAELSAKQNLKQKGFYTTKLPLEKLAEVKKKADEINYFSLNDVYDSPVTDFPSTYTQLNADGKSKTIKDRIGGPDPLRDFEKWLHEEFIEKTEWTFVKEIVNE